MILGKRMSMIKKRSGAIDGAILTARFDFFFDLQYRAQHIAQSGMRAVLWSLERQRGSQDPSRVLKQKVSQIEI